MVIQFHIYIVPVKIAPYYKQSKECDSADLIFFKFVLNIGKILQVCYAKCFSYLNDFASVRKCSEMLQNMSQSTGCSVFPDGNP